MDGNGANVIGMRLESGDLLAGVVVVDAQLKVIAATHDPILPGNEAAGSDGNIGELEGLDDLLGVEGPDIDMSGVESGKNPVLGRVEIYALDSLAASEELPLEEEKNKKPRVS